MSEEAPLLLVATPIGNLGDISLRALDALRAADIVASEDTRKTGMLLKHFDIKKPLMSFHEHNEERAGDRIMAMLMAGQRVVVVTDAGTPGIADPGYTLVRRAIAAGVQCSLIPGANAALMAMVLSGLPLHSFTFRGFPPRKSGPRQRFFAIDITAPHTLIFYESPYRIIPTLRDALAVYGDRQAALANELTKLFENVRRGTLAGMLSELEGTTPRGEFVLVIAGAAIAKHGRPSAEDDGSEDETNDDEEADDRGDAHGASGEDESLDD